MGEDLTAEPKTQRPDSAGGEGRNVYADAEFMAHTRDCQKT